MACRKTSPYCYNVLGARRRQNKAGEAKEDMVEYIPRRHERDGCQLEWSPPDAPRGTGGPTST